MTLALLVVGGYLAAIAIALWLIAVVTDHDTKRRPEQARLPTRVRSK
jgi:hypothetical protein